MKIHDVAMAEMGNIHDKSKRLKNLLEENPTTEDSLSYVYTLNLLEEADDGMMDWMSKFSLPENYEEAIKYLEAEKVKVEKVNDDIFKALEKADEIIKRK